MGNQLFERIESHSSQTGSYTNWMMPDEGHSRGKAAYGTNYNRLIALKRKLDEQTYSN